MLPRGRGGHGGRVFHVGSIETLDTMYKGLVRTREQLPVEESSEERVGSEQELEKTVEEIETSMKEMTVTSDRVVKVNATESVEETPKTPNQIGEDKAKGTRQAGQDLDWGTPEPGHSWDMDLAPPPRPSTPAPAPVGNFELGTASPSTSPVASTSFAAPPCQFVAPPPLPARCFSAWGGYPHWLPPPPPAVRTVTPSTSSGCVQVQRHDIQFGPDPNGVYRCQRNKKPKTVRFNPYKNQHL